MKKKWTTFVFHHNKEGNENKHNRKFILAGCVCLFNKAQWVIEISEAPNDTMIHHNSNL